MNDEQQLRERLERLQNELGAAQPGDADAHARVEEMRRDIRGLLEQQRVAADEQHQSVLQRLRNAIPYFESTHPRLTLALSEVVDELTRMGL
jgi:hypothetical protein